MVVAKMTAPNKIRQEGVTERGGPNRRGLQVGIGDLERHPDGECEVGEVEVTGWGGLVEVDPAVGT
jgi:hypothetical protein